MSSSQRMVQPNLQKRHTNITIIRYVRTLILPTDDEKGKDDDSEKKGSGGKSWKKKKVKKRKTYSFEIACYKNKIFNWREGVETDINEVLQTEDIYKEVSTGERANKSDLEFVFKTQDKTKILKTILDDGELQLSEKEREFILESKWKEIITFVCKKCLNEATRMPYHRNVIEQELKNLHFSIKISKPTKLQALLAIKKLKKSIKIVRARMRISLKFFKEREKGINKLLAKEKKSIVIETDEMVKSDRKKKEKEVDVSETTEEQEMEELEVEEMEELEIEELDELEEEEEVVVDSPVEEGSGKKNHRFLILLIDPFLFRAFRKEINAVAGSIEMLEACVKNESDEVIDINKIKEVDFTSKEVGNKGPVKGKKGMTRAERRKHRKEKRKRGKPQVEDHRDFGSRFDLQRALKKDEKEGFQKSNQKKNKKIKRKNKKQRKNRK